METTDEIPSGKSQTERAKWTLTLGLLAIAFTACFPAQSQETVAAQARAPDTPLEEKQGSGLAQIEHKIKPGSTLSSIARDFGTTVTRIMMDNIISDKDRIYAGSNLIIKFPSQLAEILLTDKYDKLTQEEIKDRVSQRYRDLEAEGLYYWPGELDSSPERQIGIAHVYGLNTQREGLLAFKSSGKLFDPDRYTVASWFYPLGTRLLLQTNFSPHGKKSIIVEVTDRGPNRKLLKDNNVIIDVTPAVARALSVPGLDLVKTGRFNVNLQRVRLPEPDIPLPSQRPENLP